MAKPVSNEKRADIIAHMQAGESKADISKWLFITQRTITRIWSKFKTTGSYEPEPLNSGRKPKVSDETMEQVIAGIKENPDMTLLEMIDKYDLMICESALSRRITKLGLTYKKRHSIPKNKTGLM